MKFNHTWMAASISLRWVMRLYHWSSTAHPHEGTTSRCLCVCAVCQSLVKVEVELIMDVAWLATVAAANIRAGQWQEDLCMWLLGACDWKPTEMWLRKAREMQLSRKETRTAPGSHCAVSRRGGGWRKKCSEKEGGIILESPWTVKVVGEMIQCYFLVVGLLNSNPVLLTPFFTGLHLQWSNGIQVKNYCAKDLWDCNNI